MDGKVREVIYFSKGFFGYGEMGNFRQWSLAHFMPIIVAISAIILIYKFQDRIRNSKREKNYVI